MTDLRAPFPWFGGKRRVADVVWRAFSRDVPNYIEPFAGSLAVLIARPGGPGKIETVNDRDRYLANFWRAVMADPEAVARWADAPVNEADLHARHKWLVNQAEFRERMHTDPDFFDAKIAGWWVWGLCCWIGGGWCVEPQNADGKARGRARSLDAAQMVHLSSEQGVNSSRSRGAARHDEANRPELAGVGKAVHAGTAHQRKRPVLDGTALGRGVHSGLNGVAAAPCVEWFLALQHRLRRVRVACGDWKRVLGDSVLGKGKNVGGRRPCAVFLDPPYSHEFRDPYLYSEDDGAISALVRDWALEHGDDPDLRIALCGYVGEHEMPASWTEHAWKGARGYAAEGNDNREKERIWFSPHCLRLDAQRGLFDVRETA